MERSKTRCCALLDPDYSYALLATCSEHSGCAHSQMRSSGSSSNARWALPSPSAELQGVLSGQIIATHGEGRTGPRDRARAFAYERLLAIARSSCCLLILERPSIFSRFAWL